MLQHSTQHSLQYIFIQHSTVVIKCEAIKSRLCSTWTGFRALGYTRSDEIDADLIRHVDIRTIRPVLVVFWSMPSGDQVVHLLLGGTITTHRAHFASSTIHLKALWPNEEETFLLTMISKCHRCRMSPCWFAFQGCQNFNSTGFVQGPSRPPFCFLLLRTWHIPWNSWSLEGSNCFFNFSKCENCSTVFFASFSPLAKRWKESPCLLGIWLRFEDRIVQERCFLTQPFGHGTFTAGLCPSAQQPGKNHWRVVRLSSVLCFQSST